MASDILVGAIDFGTTFSGWAILFKHEFESEPTKGFVRQWPSDTLITEKTPTVVLVKPDGKTLEAFGYEAEDRYKDLVQQGEHENYYYFRRFKMMLNKKLGEKLDKNILLEDEMGRELLALDVFAMAIKYLVEDMHTVVRNRIVDGIGKDDVHWVLTVPAIWTDTAKKFMREAGTLAGISTDKLSIALEPEAASIFCRYLPVAKRQDTTSVSLSSMSAGTKYIVLDAGGGTVDITVHEIEQSGTAKEVIPASGGGWGGTLVDQAFEELLINIVGRDAYLKFKKEHTEDWLELWRDFELKKRSVSPKKNSKIVMKIPVSVSEIYEKVNNGQTLTESIERSVYKGKIELTAGRMKFEAQVFIELFEASLSETTNHVKSLFEKSELQTVKTILMVGGFSDSLMLQDKIKTEFEKTDVIIPMEASSSIMRGALIFGHSPTSITERVMKYSYGIEAYFPFVPGEHPESRREHCDIGVLCKNCFDKHVEKGQIVKVGEPQVKRSYVPLNRNSKSLSFSVFASELKIPKYTDEGCSKVGEFIVDLLQHDGDLNRTVWISFTFSGTEIHVEAEDQKTEKKTKVTANFLG